MANLFTKLLTAGEGKQFREYDAVVGADQRVRAVHRAAHR